MNSAFSFEAEHHGNLLETHAACTKLANLPYVVFGDLGASCSDSFGLSVLLDFVVRIVFGCSKEKVIRPNAGWVIALMANLECLIECAVGQFVRNTVSNRVLFLDADDTVSADGLEGPLPEPACIAVSLCDSKPEGCVQQVFVSKEA